MEGHDGRDATPASVDPAVVGSFFRETSPLRSDASSSFIVESSCRSLHRCTNAVADKSIKWTDEKHNLYLHYLETSFLSQLHQSNGLHSWCSEEDLSNRSATKILCSKTKDFSKKNTKAGKINSKKLTDSHVDLNSTSPHDSLSTESQEFSLLVSRSVHLEIKTSAPGLATSADGTQVRHLWNNYSVGSLVKEVSDQNFVDENDEEKPNKRLKTVIWEGLNHNQVPPTGAFSMVEFSCADHFSADWENGQVRIGSPKILGGLLPGPNVNSIL